MPGSLAIRARPLARESHALTGFRLSAGLVWPVSSSPVANGAVLVGSDGRIRDVGLDARVARPPDAEPLSFPDAVLLPGLVNVHTHLELTAMRGAVEDPAFFDWIQHIRRRKASMTPEGFVEAAKEGVRECWSTGTTTVADTGDSGAAAAALGELGGRGVVYQEVFGPHPAQAEDSFGALVRMVEKLAGDAPPAVRVGVSPHAPYTVSAELFRRVAGFARAARLPLALHLAESREESAFVTAGTGPFGELWEKRGIPLPEPAASPVAYLDRCGVLGVNTLVIHAVQVSPEDCSILAERGCSIALCPRSNTRHGHGVAPAAEYLAAGMPAGLGTDSSASVGALDLFAEARAARAASGLDAAGLIRLLTLGGARALDLAREVGTLEAGKWADFCLVRAGAGAAKGGPGAADAILETRPGDVLGTWVAGRRVYASPG